MTQNKLPRFSIVIPAYNEAAYIAKTLDSLKKQNFKGLYEIIVVDNSSHDKTATIASRLGARVVHEQKPGVCQARQKGTELARGEIIISTDADTVFSPDWLSNIDRLFRDNSGYIAVAGPCKYTNGPGWGNVCTQLLFGLVTTFYLLTGRVMYVSATNIAFRKTAWRGYNTGLTQGGDELDLLRQLKKQGKVAFNSHIVTYTSARRLVRGFLYNFFVTFLIYYILEYNLSRLFGHSILGNAPAFRNDSSPRLLGLAQVCLAVAAVSLCMVYTQPGHYVRHYARGFIEISQDVVVGIHIK